MPKLTGPALSLDASGKLGTDIIYQKQRGQTTARRYARPSPLLSTAQLERRKVLGNLAKLSGQFVDYWKYGLWSHAGRMKVPVSNVLTAWNASDWFNNSSSYPFTAMRAFNIISKQVPLYTATFPGNLQAYLDSSSLDYLYSKIGQQYFAMPLFNPRTQELPPILYDTVLGPAPDAQLNGTVSGTTYLLAAFAFGTDAKHRPVWTDSVVTTLVAA